MKPCSRPSFWMWVVLAIGITAASMSASKAQSPDEAPAFAVEVSGAGDPVLLIPGLATPGEVWEVSVAGLAGDHEVHLVTLAGFAGQPPVSRAEGVFETSVRALADYLEAQGLGNVSVGGHSMGAQIALQLAAARPDLVERVLVVDSAPFYAGLVNPQATPDQAAAFGAATAQQMAAAPREQFLAMTRQGLPIQSVRPDVRERVYGWMQASDQATVAAAMGEVMGGDFRPVLEDVDAPVTVIIGWEAAMPVPHSMLLGIYESQYAGAQAGGGAEIRVIEGARHFVMLDQPEAFAAALSDWARLD